jgi:hypothetical protein
MPDHTSSSLNPIRKRGGARAGVRRLANRRLQRLLPAFALAACVLSSLGIAAGATPQPIEGVWSFNGGTVDIQSQPGGTYRGVVTSPTKFASCSHPVNEDMWTEIRQQPDGSYFGLHQWYFEEPCARNPTPGPTAWRVLQNPNGSRFLRVCFSAPGSNSQPTIAPNGSSAHVTYGCSDSALIATLPTVSHQTGGTTGSVVSFRSAVGLPRASKCVRKRTLRIVLHDPPYDPLKEVVVRVNGHKVIDLRNLKRLKKPIVLKRLPNGSFKVRVLAITVLDQHLTGGRTYHACKGNVTSKVKLRHSTHHHPHGKARK